MKYRLIRDVTRNECFWLGRDYKAGETVFEFKGATYGCVGDGIACTDVKGEGPFNEFPVDALEAVQ